MGRRERDPYEPATRCEECGLRDPGEWHECKRRPPGVPEVTDHGTWQQRVRRARHEHNTGLTAHWLAYLASLPEKGA